MNPYGSYPCGNYPSSSSESTSSVKSIRELYTKIKNRPSVLTMPEDALFKKKPDLSQIRENYDSYQKVDQTTKQYFQIDKTGN